MIDTSLPAEEIYKTLEATADNVRSNQQQAFAKAVNERFDLDKAKQEIIENNPDASKEKIEKLVDKKNKEVENERKAFDNEHHAISNLALGAVRNAAEQSKDAGIDVDFTYIYSERDKNGNVINDTQKDHDIVQMDVSKGDDSFTLRIPAALDADGKELYELAKKGDIATKTYDEYKEDLAVEQAKPDWQAMAEIRDSKTLDQIIEDRKAMNETLLNNELLAGKENLLEAVSTLNPASLQPEEMPKEIREEVDQMVLNARARNITNAEIADRSPAADMQQSAARG